MAKPRRRSARERFRAACPACEGTGAYEHTEYNYDPPPPPPAAVKIKLPDGREITPSDWAIRSAYTALCVVRCRRRKRFTLDRADLMRFLYCAGVTHAGLERNNLTAHKAWAILEGGRVPQGDELTQVCFELSSRDAIRFRNLVKAVAS